MPSKYPVENFGFISSFMYIGYVKSSRLNTNLSNVANIDPLVSQMTKEKEALVSMFLANASITELAAQYKLIDDLIVRINQQKIQ